MTNSIIDQQQTWQDFQKEIMPYLAPYKWDGKHASPQPDLRPKPFILTAEERDKAKERCGYIAGLPLNKARALAQNKFYEYQRISHLRAIFGCQTLG